MIREIKRTVPSGYLMLVVLLVAQLLTLVLYLRANLPMDRKLLLRAGIAAAVIIVGVVPLLPVMFTHANVTGFWIQQPAISVVYNSLFYHNPQL